MKLDKRANILIGNIVFIILNLAFLAIIVLFLFSKTGSAAVLEEKYAKQIALIIDSAKPGMTIVLNMEDAIKKAQKEGQNINSIVSISENTVTVKLRENGGYSYSFFTNFNFDGIESNYYLNGDKKGFVFVVE